MRTSRSESLSVCRRWKHASAHRPWCRKKTKSCSHVSKPLGIALNSTPSVTKSRGCCHSTR
eukprot:scaffold69759_cov51-Phaeocystis_antarctica.AAC.2